MRNYIKEESKRKERGIEERRKGAGKKSLRKFKFKVFLNKMPQPSVKFLYHICILMRKTKPNLNNII